MRFGVYCLFIVSIVIRFTQPKKLFQPPLGSMPSSRIRSPATTIVSPSMTVAGLNQQPLRSEKLFVADFNS